MRLRIDITTPATSIPWADVLRPGRGLIYSLLTDTAPQLATRLHTTGWGPHHLVPFGHNAPVFPHARRQPGTYAAGGRGTLELGSPLPGMIDTWLEALADRTILDWAGTALHIQRLTPLAPPTFTTGRAELRTTTPIVLKAPTPVPHHNSHPKPTDLLPYEDGFTAAFEHNLHRKAETLDLPPDITLERITWIGAKRSFAIKNGHRVGTPIGVELRGSPTTLRALWSWGLGQANTAGFGWIAP